MYDHSNTSTIHVNSSQPSTSFSEDDEPSILETPSALCDLVWYLESRASHNLTHDNNNLTTKISYSGHDVDKIGNNIALPIKHVGYSLYFSMHCS